MVLKEFKMGPVYQGSLTKGLDIINGLTTVMKQNNIAAGIVSGIGALSEAQIGYFNAQTKSYEKKSFQESMEIVSLKGNISFKDNELFPHLHVVLSRMDFSSHESQLGYSQPSFAFLPGITGFFYFPFLGKQKYR